MGTDVRLARSSRVGDEVVVDDVSGDDTGALARRRQEVL